MTILTMAIADAIAIAALCTLYMVRHRNRELMISYAVINAGIFTVSVALVSAGSNASAMGMGLFGVLSIIRLRSTALSQREVGYYFVALSVGMIAGVNISPAYIAFGLMATLVGLIAVLDSRSTPVSTDQTQTVTADRAISDEEELKAYLSARLGYTVTSVKITELDMVNNLTRVTVTYQSKETTEGGTPAAVEAAQPVAAQTVASQAPAAYPAAPQVPTAEAHTTLDTRMVRSSAPWWASKTSRYKSLRFTPTAQTSPIPTTRRPPQRTARRGGTPEGRRPMTNAAANIIPAEWKSISLEAMNEKAAMQTRVDRKYIVDAETAAKVLSTLDADASVMEIKGQRDFAYDSVYFDTPQMQSYHSAAYSRDDTFKIRTRSYLDSELTFLEVKTDGEQDMTVKKRIPYTFENRDQLTAEGHEYITAALGDILAGPVHKLEAVLTTGYRRTTVFLPQSEKNPVASRMTVDTNLTWTPLSENILMAGVNYRNFHGNLVGTTYGLPNAVIIETKSGVEPSVADQHLWDAGITPAKISKFATGMAALNPQLASNKWEETLKNWMHLEPVDGTRLNVDDMTEEDYQKLLTEHFAAA